ncbi:hypothetical protein VTH82DRAFT_5016 [Thermothelomyces myriococcoides]
MSLKPPTLKQSADPAATIPTDHLPASDNKLLSASSPDVTGGAASTGSTSRSSVSHPKESNSGGSRNQPDVSRSQETAGKNESALSGDSGKKSKGVLPPPEQQERKAGEAATQKLSIIIYKGAPHDSYDKRHTALFIEYFDKSGDPSGTDLIDIHGIVKKWALRHTVNRDPTGSMSYGGSVVVKEWEVDVDETGRSSRRLRDDIINTRIDNEDLEFNCQKWLENAMKRLKLAGWLTEMEEEKSLSDAFDLILQAPEQPLSFPGANGSLLDRI